MKNWITDEFNPVDEPLLYPGHEELDDAHLLHICYVEGVSKLVYKYGVRNTV